MTSAAIRPLLDRIESARVRPWLLPLPLVLIPMLWILAYFLRVDESALFYQANLGLRGLAAIGFLAIGVVLAIADRPGHWLGGAMLAVLAFYALCFTSAFLHFGPVLTLKKVAGQFALNALPAVIVGAWCARQRAAEDLLEGIEKFGLVFSPAAIVYVVRFFLLADQLSPSEVRRLGGMDYMSFAYSLLPLMAASCLLLLRAVSSRRVMLGRGLLICAYWLALVFSQTRGAVLGVATLMVCLGLSGFGGSRRRFAILGAVLLTLFGIGYQTLPILVGEYNLRYSKAYTDDALNYAGTTARGLAEARAGGVGHQGAGYKFLVDNVGNGVFVDTKKNVCIVDNKEIARSLVSDDQLLKSLRESDCAIKLSRMSLIEIVLSEIRRDPLRGMGPLAFQVRYFDFHPHSIFLELLVEFGLAIGLGLIALLTFLVIRAWRRAGPGSADRGLLLLAAAHLPMFTISGSIWADTMFSFFLAYLLVSGHMPAPKLPEAVR